MQLESVLSKLVSGRLSTYAAVSLMFTYSILLDRDFACTCEGQVFDCYLYLGLPSSIILLLILWTDSSFQRVMKYLCSSCCSTCSPFMCSLIRDIVKAFLVGLLWIAFVLLDGDWYICCRNDHSPLEQPLACKDKAKTTEMERVMIAELKNESRVWGGFLLFGIILVGSVMSVLKPLKQCRCLCCDRKFLYSKLILEEQEMALVQILRDSAKEDLTKKIQEKIDGEDWGECFDVAVELIQELKPHVKQEDETRGGASETQRQEEEPGTSTTSV